MLDVCRVRLVSRAYMGRRAVKELRDEMGSQDWTVSPALR